MHQHWKTLLTLSTLASSSAVKDLPFDAHVIIQQPGLLSVLGNNGTGPGLNIPTTRPHRSIDLSEIVPAQDSAGNHRCCPIGTVNDGTGCVFPQSSVCPEGTYLDGNNCISKKPPSCPEGLVYNGRNCIGPAPTCPPGSWFNGEACESEAGPGCIHGFRTGFAPQVSRPGVPLLSNLRTGAVLVPSPPVLPSQHKTFGQ
ncbi:unnamed protein product [Fusarium langsethiae]|nr:unnamed protein product [Fusarium langsethiae]